MALVATPMAHGNGLNCTDDLGGCISYGRAVRGNDADYQGPLGTIEGRFKWNGSGNFRGALAFGADGAAMGRRRLPSP
jgi:hypothetical protein